MKPIIIIPVILTSLLIIVGVSIYFIYFCEDNPIYEPINIDGTNYALSLLAEDQQDTLIDARFEASNIKQIQLLPHFGDLIGSYHICEPTDGDDFVFMSTGIAGTTLVTTNAENPGSEKGTDFSGDNDYAKLTLNLVTPPGSEYAFVDIQFFSAEYPERDYGDDQDYFEISVDSPTQGISTFNIDTGSGYFMFDPEDLVGTGFDIYSNSDYMNRDNQVSTSGQNDDAGATTLVSLGGTRFPVSSNEVITVTFTIKDVGDNYVDSAVFIDSLRFL